VKANPLSLQGLTPRLATALQLGFVYPDWLKERLGEAAAHQKLGEGFETEAGT